MQRVALFTTASHVSAIALATEEARQRSTVPLDKTVVDTIVPAKGAPNLANSC